MRYAQGGGLTPGAQQRREQVRMRAAEMFAAGEHSQAVAARWRVSLRTVERWRRAWREQGPAGLVSRGPIRAPRLSADQVAVLEQELAAGPVAHGWPDQTWTLARIVEVARRRFGVSYSLAGMWRLLRRNGWSHQLPARRAVERDEQAVAV